MALPARSFYSVHEAAARWDTMAADVVGWAIEGRIALSATLPPVQGAGRTIAGLVEIAATDVYALFRRDGSGPASVMIRRIRDADRQGEDWVWITDPADGVPITPWDVLISRREIMRFEAAHELITMQERQAASRRSGPGRPAAHDWDGFYIALCKRIHEFGLPERQADLIRDMQEWFDSRASGVDGAPDESTIRRKVQAVWYALQAAPA